MAHLRVRCRVIALMALLSLVTGAGSTTHADASTNPLEVPRTVPPGPVLIGATCMGRAMGNLMVTGEQFTSGAEVEVLLFEAGNPNPAVIHTTRASRSIAGPNGSTDPALGFQHGGLVGIALESWCQHLGMVRAYDHQAATWSNWMPVDRGYDAAWETTAVRKGGDWMG